MGLLIQAGLAWQTLATGVGAGVAGGSVSARSSVMGAVGSGAFVQADRMSVSAAVSARAVTGARGAGAAVRLPDRDETNDEGTDIEHSPEGIEAGWGQF
ncbi:MAG: hypothetical protein MUE46_15515 [Xanthomonadales bacterium]|nr:hypothetical protein [Xanthomonadales bacterium]